MQPPDLEAVQRAIGDRYEVLSLAGAGGMGAVFRARHRTLGHIVAVKVLPPEVATSAMRSARFRLEATLGASLDHPSIVRVYDFDTREGITFLIMTHVRGDTLEARLRNPSPIPTDQVLRLVRELADALGYAHRRGIVHRDVKPSNILIDEDSGRAMLTDFGIARVEGTAQSALTQPGDAIGTPGYMAPEQAVGAHVDGRTDLHSLAIVACEALGITFTGGPGDRTERARTVRTARPELTPAEAMALVAPLDEAPESRPESAAAWLAALDSAGRRRWRRWAAVAVALIAAAVGLRAALGSRGSCGARDAPPRLAVMPFAVLGTPPYPASQLPAYFVSRFRPVERLSEVVSFGRVAAELGTEPPSSDEARDVACRLGAAFYVQGSVSFVGNSVTLTATLYERGRERRTGHASGRLGVDESDVMDHVWAQLYPEFTPGPDVTLPGGGPGVLAAYLNAEAAFRRGDYRTARDEYTQVIHGDTTFSVARLRLALVAAQVDPTEEGLGARIRSAIGHQRGLSPADSLLVDGFTRLMVEGDGGAALERFKHATELAPGYTYAWYVLGEFYYHFGGLFGEPIEEASAAFEKVLDVDPRFSPAIGHLIAFASQRGDMQETERLIRSYLRIDSTSAVAEAVGIVDTLLLRSAADQLRLLRGVCRHSFLPLQYLASQAVNFGTKAQREGPVRDVLRCLERRAATDAERARALRMGVAADLAAGWADSARQRLERAGRSSWAGRERDRWVLVAHATGLPALGDWSAAAERVARGAADSDAVADWLLARMGSDRARHAAALERLAAHHPLPASLAVDLQARQALARGDSARALQLWTEATRHYAVLSVPFELVASLWPLRLDMVRVAVARGDHAAATAVCQSFETIFGYADQAAQPETERLCRNR